jgi:hypothetical protein
MAVMSRFLEWTPDDEPAVIIDTSTPDGWDEIRAFYAPIASVRPLERLIEVATAHQVRTVVVERRYIDADYRSEHSRFYSTTYRRYPSVCHRLHFFTTDVPSDLANLGHLQDAYVGYSVMRPFEMAPVGRTVIAPPPELDGATLCVASDEVHLFGWALTATGVPFISQDAQYLRCAHAAEWMVLYHAHLVHGLPRRLPSEIHEASVGGEVVDRQLPSMGLSLGQMLNSLHGFGLSPGRLLLPQTREESQANGPLLSLPAILCRYVNSQMPPIVVSPEHAWVIAGYGIEGTGPAHDNIVFYRHDDSAGPYIRVADPWNEPEPQHHPWLVALPPLPQKAYLTAERAEALATLWIRAAAVGSPATAQLLAEGRLTLRTYGIRATSYKGALGGRAIPDEVAQLYRLANWPRYIWVIEALDRDARDRGDPSVHGEVLLDATAHHLTSANDTAPLLGLHLDGTAVLQTPDHNEVRRIGPVPWQPYESGCPAASS